MLKAILILIFILFYFLWPKRDEWVKNRAREHSEENQQDKRIITKTKKKRLEKTTIIMPVQKELMLSATNSTLLERMKAVTNTRNRLEEEMKNLSRSLAEEVSTTLLNFVIPSNSSVKQKKILAADLIEIYDAARHFHPGLADKNPQKNRRLTQCESPSIRSEAS